GRHFGITLAASLFLLSGAGCGGAPRAAEKPTAPATQAALTPAQIAARSLPAIVSIRSSDSLGTGLPLRPRGWVATNLHVIAYAEELVVVLPDKSEKVVEQVVAVDEERDLAIVKIDVTRLPTLDLGDSGGVHAGDPVVAIGHPLGLEDTVS